MALKLGKSESSCAFEVNSRAYNYRYIVYDDAPTTTSNTQSPADIANFVSLQTSIYVGDKDPANDKYYCTSITPEQDASGLKWRVVVRLEYTRVGIDDDWVIRFGRKSFPQVLSMAYGKRWGWYIASTADGGGETEAPTFPSESWPDVPQTGINNSLGDVFDPPPEQEERLRTIHLTKTMTCEMAKPLLEFDDTMNEVAITIADIIIPKCCGLIQVEGERAWYFHGETRKPCMKMTFEITINPKTWRRAFVDQGMRGKVSGVVHTAREEGSADRKSSKPMKLDGLGNFLGVTERLSRVWFLGFWTKRATNWGAPAGLTLTGPLFPLALDSTNPPTVPIGGDNPSTPPGGHVGDPTAPIIPEP